MYLYYFSVCFFFSSRRRHTRWPRDWSSDVCSSDLRAHSIRFAREGVMQRARAYGLRELAPAFASTRASPHAVFGALAEHTFRSARAPTGAAEAAALPDAKHILSEGPAAARSNALR